MQDPLKGAIPEFGPETDLDKLPVLPTNKEFEELSDALSKNITRTKRNIPFITFSLRHRREIQVENPSLNMTQLAQALGRMWGKLSKEEKSKYSEPLSPGPNKH